MRRALSPACAVLGEQTSTLSRRVGLCAPLPLRASRGFENLPPLRFSVLGRDALTWRILVRLGEQTLTRWDRGRVCSPPPKSAAPRKGPARSAPAIVPAGAPCSTVTLATRRNLQSFQDRSRPPARLSPTARPGDLSDVSTMSLAGNHVLGLDLSVRTCAVARRTTRVPCRAVEQPC